MYFSVIYWSSTSYLTDLQANRLLRKQDKLDNTLSVEAEGKKPCAVEDYRFEQMEQCYGELFVGAADILVVVVNG